MRTKNISIFICILIVILGCNSEKPKTDLPVLTMNPEMVDTERVYVIEEDTTIEDNSIADTGRTLHLYPFGRRYHYIINEDSIEVKNKVKFGRFKYDGDQYKEQDAVIFTLHVTNKGNKLIPDIQTARWRGKIRIMINGQNAMWMSLANMCFGEEHSLAKDSTDSWPWELQITGPDAIDYGDIFTWQWEYMGIKSPIMQVDIKKRTFVEVNEHIKTDREFY